MNKQLTFDLLQKEFDLKDSDFYFLDLIPLIAIIWADGQNQEGELKILHKFVIEHIANIDRLSNSKIISVADANSFLQRFAYHRPDPRLIQELMHLFFKENGSGQQHRTLLNYCVDIAAACTTHYPFQQQERVVAEEKALLESLFQKLNIPFDLETSTID